jgi:hypothetical protein
VVSWPMASLVSAANLEANYFSRRTVGNDAGAADVLPFATAHLKGAHLKGIP